MMSETAQRPECLHESVHFGSGDYYIFCGKCARCWVTCVSDIAAPELANKGGQTHLSGAMRSAAKQTTPEARPGAFDDGVHTIGPKGLEEKCSGGLSATSHTGAGSAGDAGENTSLNAETCSKGTSGDAAKESTGTTEAPQPGVSACSFYFRTWLPQWRQRNPDAKWLAGGDAINFAEVYAQQLLAPLESAFVRRGQIAVQRERERNQARAALARSERDGGTLVALLWRLVMAAGRTDIQDERSCWSWTAAADAIEQRLAELAELLAQRERAATKYCDLLRKKIEEQRAAWEHQVLVRADLERKVKDLSALHLQREAEIAELHNQLAQHHLDTMKSVQEMRNRRADAAEAALPDDLREQGWMVAVHNDYRQNGERFTFWLLTKGAASVKGEGKTDAEALGQIRAALTGTQ